MADLLITILLAVPASVGAGIGVEVGKDIYLWLKQRRLKNISKLKEITHTIPSTFSSPFKGAYESGQNARNNNKNKLPLDNKRIKLLSSENS